MCRFLWKSLTPFLVSFCKPLKCINKCVLHPRLNCLMTWAGPLAAYVSPCCKWKQIKMVTISSPWCVLYQRNMFFSFVSQNIRFVLDNCSTVYSVWPSYTWNGGFNSALAGFMPIIYFGLTINSVFQLNSKQLKKSSKHDCYDACSRNQKISFLVPSFFSFSFSTVQGRTIQQTHTSWGNIEFPRIIIILKANQ